jgi:hypothetical protein
MTGLTNYTAFNLLDWLTGQDPEPALPSVWLALFTAVGTDAGTGFTEVSGGSYARVQVAGNLAAASTISAASPNITMGSSNPGWVIPGMSVFDTTVGFFLGTVLTYSGTALVLTANAAHAGSGGTDNLTFSAWPQATGTGPASTLNGSAITFAAATASWGTVVAFGLTDAVTSGNLLMWDYMGAFQWMPATVSSASPGVITAHAHGISNGGFFVFSTEFGGTAPGFSAGNYTGILTAAGVATDTLNVTGVNTNATGNGMIRQVTEQSIPSGVTASFAASTITLTAA